MKYVFFFLYIAVLFSCSETVDNPDNINFTTIFEKSGGTKTPTYGEVIQFYKDLDKAYVSIKTYEVGTTDIGKPLTLVTFNPNRTFESEFLENQDVRRILINNGIHPGESDGIDATMMLMRDLAQGTIEAPKNTWIGAIAVYNIGGALNRNSTSRTNQNGPEAYGFRGNAKNYDLNRDFIKNDTKNSQAFTEIFHLVRPDVFIDNHVSNGADYQYTLTHLFTQHNKLGGVLGDYIHQALWNTIGLMVETHMLKPYKPRVEGTYELMKSALKITAQEGEKIRALRKDAFNAFAKADTYPLTYTIDSTQTTTLNFLGYEGKYIESNVTQKTRLKYNRDKPFTKEVTYYDYFKPSNEVVIPKAYVIPRGYRDIVLKLRKNGIRFNQIKRDTTFKAQVYRIDNYNTYTNAYEGHYPHYGTTVKASTEEVTILKGGYIVSLEDNKEGLRYLLETLEPEANDSFFNWNFFDTILQQKEGFSPYVWEDKAFEFLNQHPDIKAEFEAKRIAEPVFEQNWHAQLDWIHKKSPNYEKAHLRYPIVRMLR